MVLVIYLHFSASKDIIITVAFCFSLQLSGGFVNYVKFVQCACAFMYFIHVNVQLTCKQ